MAEPRYITVLEFALERGIDPDELDIVVAFSVQVPMRLWDKRASTWAYDYEALLLLWEEDQALQAAHKLGYRGT